jgi:hypothetical protein
MVTDAPDPDGSTTYVVSNRIGPLDARVLVRRGRSSSTTWSSTTTSRRIILPKTRNAEPVPTGRSDSSSTRCALGFHLISFLGSATNSNATEGGTAVLMAIVEPLTPTSCPPDVCGARTKAPIRQLRESKNHSSVAPPAFGGQALGPDFPRTDDQGYGGPRWQADVTGLSAPRFDHFSAREATRIHASTPLSYGAGAMLTLQCSTLPGS